MLSRGPLRPPTHQQHQLQGGGYEWLGWALGRTGERSQGNAQDWLMEVGRLRAGRHSLLFPLGPEETPLYGWHCHGIPLQPDEGPESQKSRSQRWEVGWGLSPPAKAAEDL